MPDIEPGDIVLVPPSLGVNKGEYKVAAITAGYVVIDGIGALDRREVSFVRKGTPGAI